MKKIIRFALAGSLLLASLATVCAQPTEVSGFFNIRSFGAVADGRTKCTAAIAKAIETASASGGGTIYFPPGIFLTGPIHLRSHITLYLDAGAVVKFSTNFDDYLPMVPSRWEGIEVTNFSPLIYAHDAVGIAVQGRGTLDGQGQFWWKRMYDVRKQTNAAPDKYQQEFKRLNPHPLVSESYKSLEMGFCRPPFFQPNNCTNVLVEGVTFINSPFWTVTPLYCEDVTIRAVTIQNPLSPNTDGINPDSCHDVHITDCHISVGDDCITIKSGRDADGRRVGRPAENYTISNCTMANGHGGVVIGSEASGGVKNITIANCIFDGTERGIRIKSARGRGGVIEDVRVSNIVMRNIKEEAVVITSFYEKSSVEPVTDRTPVFRNIRMSGLTGEAKIAVEMTGLEEMPLEGISLSDFKLDAITGISIMDAKDVSLRNLTINTVRGPVVKADRTVGLELDGIRTLKPHDQVPLFDLADVKNVFVHGCSTSAGMAESIRVSAKSAPELVLEGNNFGPSKVQIVGAAPLK